MVEVDTPVAAGVQNLLDSNGPGAVEQIGDPPKAGDVSVIRDAQLPVICLAGPLRVRIGSLVRDHSCSRAGDYYHTGVFPVRDDSVTGVEV